MEIKGTLSDTLDETEEDTKDIKKAVEYWSGQFIDRYDIIGFRCLIIQDQQHQTILLQ